MVTQQVPQTQPPAGPAAEISPPGAPQPRTLTADTQEASPEEQALYDQFVSKGMMLVYDKKFFPQVVDMLEGEGDPAEGLALAASKVIARVLTAAKDAGAELSGDVAFHGAKELFEDLAELSREAGIKDFSTDPDSFERAYFLTLDYLRKILEGTGDINQAAAQADLDMLQQMDQSGGLEELFMSLAAKDDEASGGAPPAGPEQPAAPAPKPTGLMPQGAM